MNPNSFNTTGAETNEPNEWDALAEINTSNEGELTEATPNNDIAEAQDRIEKAETASETGKEGELPGDENDGWSVIDQPTYTGYEGEVTEAAPDNNIETGDETIGNTGTEVETTGFEGESAPDTGIESTGVETA